VKFRIFGEKSQPVVCLLHGGGLSWWAYKPIIEKLKKNYHVVVAIIDGHDEDSDHPFISIEHSAVNLVEYIDDNYRGHVFAIIGLPLGAQILCDVLSKRKDISEHAVVESALIFPILSIKALTVPAYRLFYGLIKHKWFAKIQAKTLYIPDNLFNQYYESSKKISKQSLIHITLSNGSFHLNPQIADTASNVLILVGEKELSVMKSSARQLNKTIPNSRLTILKKCGHGELYMKNPDAYIHILLNHFN